MIFNVYIYILILSCLRSEIDYLTEIQPIFNNHCVECHVSINGSGALELDSYEYLMQGDSNNGPVVSPFNAERSLLYRVLLPDSVIVPNEPICCRMPKNTIPLHITDQIKIYNWINQGANEFSLSNIQSNNVYENTNITIYPNPFNSSATIQYFLKKDNKVVLTIYDLEGKQINMLSNKFETEGVKSINWDSNDSNGKKVSSGIYFVSIMVNYQKEIKKMFLIR